MLFAQSHARAEGSSAWPKPCGLSLTSVVLPAHKEPELAAHFSCEGHGAGRGTPTPLPSALYPLGRTATQAWGQMQALGNADRHCMSGEVPWARFRTYFWTGIKFHGSSWMPPSLKENILCSEMRSLQLALGGPRGCQQGQEVSLWVLESFPAWAWHRGEQKLSSRCE